jgi:hypothetical protein
LRLCGDVGAKFIGDGHDTSLRLPGASSLSDQVRDGIPPSFEAASVSVYEDKRLETLVFHVDGEAEFAGNTGFGDLFDVSDIDTAFKTENAFILLLEDARGINGTCGS